MWFLVAGVGAGALGWIATARGEPINAVWLVVAAVASYAIGYRFYSRFIAYRVLELDDNRATPAERLEDGRDFVPTNKWVLFGHHFAAIAGPGPLVGPILAAQFGYLPGTLWIVMGGVLGGAVQDFVVLFCSVRRDGKSLGQMAKDEISGVAGFAALFCGALDRDHHYCRGRAGGRECAEVESVGILHHRHDRAHRVRDGHLYALHSRRAARSKLRCWDSFW